MCNVHLVILNKMQKNSNNCRFCEKKHLNELGFDDFWMNYVMNENYTVIKIKQRIYVKATQILLNEIQMSVIYANIL